MFLKVMELLLKCLTLKLWRRKACANKYILQCKFQMAAFETLHILTEVEDDSLEA
jgi:hypothetical protein